MTDDDHNVLSWPLEFDIDGYLDVAGDYVWDLAYRYQQSTFNLTTLSRDEAEKAYRIAVHMIETYEPGEGLDEVIGATEPLEEFAYDLRKLHGFEDVSHAARRQRVLSLSRQRKINKKS